MKIFLVLLFFMPLSFCFGLNLKEKFMEAEPGSFVVTEQNKTYTLLHVHSINAEELILEEFCIPSHLVIDRDWKRWVASGAEGHTSWTFYAIDLVENRLLECYSFTRKAHLPVESMDLFLTTLLELDLTLLSESERFQTGPTHRPGEVGETKPWGPPMFREGQKIQNASYLVYSATWPRDRSELSEKKIVLYFDKDRKQFPFPYWLQARERGLTFKVRAVDSGKNLQSPQKTLPRRSPHFIGGITRENEKAIFTLRAPAYYHHFTLYAIDLSTNPHLTLSLPMTMRRDRECVRLAVDQKKLEETLIQGHQYMWIAASEEFDCYAEMERPITFKMP